MLNISSFITAFTSICWFILSLRYTNISSALSTNNADSLFQALTICFLPIITIWIILALIQNSYKERQMMSLINKNLDLIKKNADATSSLSIALLNTETEIKNGFILQEFNLIISDTNELLAEIIKRSNSISSAQMEHLWTRTAGGERWLIAKTFIETYNFQSGFAEHLQKKALKDTLLKGSILEFYTRYQNLRTLLETADKQRFFYNMIEYGALGKVYHLISPIAEFLLKQPNEKSTAKPISQSKKEPVSQFSLEEETISFPSFLSDNSNKAPILQKNEPSTDINNGLRAIREELLSPVLSEELDTPPAPKISHFDNTKIALQNLNEENQQREKSTLKAENKKVISLDELEKEINASPENNYDEYAYPFGAWFNDKTNK